MCARFRVFHAIETGWRSVAHRVSRSVVAKPHNVKRCSLAAEVQDPGNPCQLRGTIAHEVALVEARAQISGNRSRHCHAQTHLTLPSWCRGCSSRHNQRAAALCVWCKRGWRETFQQHERIVRKTATASLRNKVPRRVYLASGVQFCLEHSLIDACWALVSSAITPACLVGGAQLHRAAHFSEPARISIPSANK